MTTAKVKKQTVTLNHEHRLQVAQQTAGNWVCELFRMGVRDGFLGKSHWSSQSLVCPLSHEELWRIRGAGRKLYCSLSLFLPSPLHYHMRVTHSNHPIFLSALFLFQVDIHTMDKTCKYNSSFNGSIFSPILENYLDTNFIQIKARISLGRIWKLYCK